jgi:hypothetical protein
MSAREEAKCFMILQDDQGTVTTAYELRAAMIDRLRGLAVRKACPDSKTREDGRFRRNASENPASQVSSQSQRSKSFLQSLGQLSRVFKSKKSALEGVGEKLGREPGEGAEILSRAVLYSTTLVDEQGDDLEDVLQERQDKEDGDDAMKDFACILRELSLHIFASKRGDGQASLKQLKQLRWLSPELFDVLFLLFVLDGSKAAVHHFHSQTHALLAILDDWFNPDEIPGDDKCFQDRFFGGGKPRPGERWRFVQPAWPHSEAGDASRSSDRQVKMPTVYVERVRDPEWVHASTGAKCTSGGECGLFADDDIPANRVITGYGGMPLTPGSNLKLLLKTTVSRRLLPVAMSPS